MVSKISMIVFFLSYGIAHFGVAPLGTVAAIAAIIAGIALMCNA